MFHNVLSEPEILANTGNIGRLCVATGVTLHLVGRPGFHLDDRSLWRVGLDYWRGVCLERHEALAAFTATADVERLFCLSAHAETRYTRVRYQASDAFLFGSESRGLPAEALEGHAVG